MYSCFIDEECPKISLAEMLDDLDIGQEDATGEEGGEMLEQIDKDMGDFAAARMD